MKLETVSLRHVASLPLYMTPGQRTDHSDIQGSSSSSFHNEDEFAEVLEDYQYTSKHLDIFKSLDCRTLEDFHQAGIAPLDNADKRKTLLDALITLDSEMMSMEEVREIVRDRLRTGTSASRKRPQRVYCLSEIDPPLLRPFDTHFKGHNERFLAINEYLSSVKARY